MPAIVKKIFVTILFISSFLTGVFGSYFYLKTAKIFVPKNDESKNEYESVVLKEGSYNLLLMGYGGAGHDGGTLTDVIMIVNVNPERKKLTFVSIPRDLWVDIPVRSDLRENHKINAAYAIGGDDKKFPLKEPQYKGEAGASTLSKKVVAEVTGLSVHYFLAVDFEGFKKIVDILGGIDVNVPRTFDDYFYPVKGLENETCGISGAKIAEYHQIYSGFELEKQFTCRYEHIHFDAGKNHIDGEAALKFVRSRHSNEHGGDFARSERQHAVLVAIKDKLISMNSVSKTDDLYGKFIDSVRTDATLEVAKDLAKIFGNPSDYKISFTGLTEDNVLMATKSLDGQFILIPKKGEGVFSEVQKFIFEEIEKN